MSCVLYKTGHQQTTMTPEKRIITLLILSAQLCHGFPTVLIDSGKPRCVTIDAPQDTIVRVLYEAPDIIIDKQDPKYGPTYLTVNVKPANRVFDTDLHNAPIRQRLKPLSHLMEAKKGEVTHQFEVDGTATICLRSSIASAKNVMAFAMRVETSEEVPGIRAEKKRKDAAAVAAATTDVDQHLTHMELELKRISLAMNHVLKEADLNKDQDARFHDQTLAMHRATTFWPIVQVCVLLMTGFTQASHIVRFFKSRRII